MKKDFLKGIIALVFCIVFLTCKTTPVNAQGSSFQIIADGKSYFFYYPQISYGLKGACLLGTEEIIERIVKDNKVAPVNATVTFNPQNKDPFFITEEKSGKVINAKKLQAKIEHALNAGKNKVVIKSEECKAQITKEQLQKQTFLRGEFYTEYPYSSAPRKANIKLASSLISGAIVAPNDTFSFNQRVGKRTEERGFLPATVIQNGEYTEGVGGGVCQVSSTLYNALLLSGLTVTESHQHSLSVGYVLPSFDAMVSEFSDLKFINGTGSPVYIAGYATDNRLTFKIYGEKSEYTYKVLSNVIKVIEAQTLTQVKKTGSEVNVKAQNGIKSEGYLQIFKGDKLIKTTLLRKDSYSPVTGITYIEEQSQQTVQNPE